MNEKPYRITRSFFGKMRYLTNGRHSWRIERPTLFEGAMDNIWEKTNKDKSIDFSPADDYVLMQQEREGLPEPKYPLGPNNPLVEEKIGNGIRLIFALRNHCKECKEEFFCCKLCNKNLTFFDIGLYGD